MSPSERTAGTLLEALRNATRDAHARVDAAFGSCDFAVDDDYVRFLIAQGAAWESLRPVLTNGSLVRADALRADLDALGVETPGALAAGPLPAAHSLGMRYVLEGSRLGSTVLLRLLDLRGSPHALSASRYLRTSADPSAWKHLSTLLQTDRDGGDKIGPIIDDALFVFGLFESAWWATDSATADVTRV